MTLRELFNMIEEFDPDFLDVPLQFLLEDGGKAATLKLGYPDEIGSGWPRSLAGLNTEGWLTIVFEIAGGYKLIRKSN